MPLAPPSSAALPADARAAVLVWFDARGRALSFRGTRDPYAILVSEVMAQQTQISRVVEAWSRFLGRFPTVSALASASPADVLRAWRGMGYDRRALNLQRAARVIVAEHGGQVPRDVGALEDLPGVGPYTARAVASIAFGAAVGALDTNVRRVLGRALGGGDGLGPAALQAAADASVDPVRPGDWTHAVMDIGATLCRPTRPRCDECPLQRWCRFARSARENPTGMNPTRSGARPRARIPAPSFPSTTRWLRGRIVDRLRDVDGATWIVVEAPIGDHDETAVEAALNGLAHDGIVELDPALPRRARLSMVQRAALPRDRRAPATLRAMIPSASSRSKGTETAVPLPADDPEPMTLDLRGLRQRWALAAARTPITAEAMAGADHRAQARGVPGEQLMEQAGAAVAAAGRALAVDTERWGRGPIVILAGPGNNGGDGLVAARRLAAVGAPVVVALVAAEARPSTPDAARNWDRIVRDPRITIVHTPVARDVAMLGQGIEKAAIVVDALLGTGVRGELREPIRSAVEIINRARGALVPVLAVDTPTAINLTSGDPSDPAVRADLTVTFHRPKTGLLTRNGAALAGRVLVAPIGIPPEVDHG